MTHRWDEFVIEGDALYNHLINRYDELFDGDIITHFDMRYQGESLLHTKETANKYM